MTQQRASDVTNGSAYITTKDGTDIYYKDWGVGQPLVFHHGWPLSADDWDAQMMFFLAHGYRADTDALRRQLSDTTWTHTLPTLPSS